MTIQFWLDDEEETHITTMYGMETNPFSVGETINLSMEDRVPNEYQDYLPEVVKRLVAEDEIRRKLFNHKKITLLREDKYLEMKRGSLTIEYHCKLEKE